MIEKAAADSQFQLEMLGFALRDREIVAPINMTLPQGRVVGLIGRNGSGTTLIKMLARQQIPVAPELLVKELVALGRYPWHGALGRFTQADSSKIDDAMAATGVSIFADQLVDVLSDGERQRTWLAMLLAQDVGWLLLDEPISALDLAHQVNVLSLVRDLSSRRGLGVLIVLHDINMAVRFCDELIALRDGNLIARGTPNEIMRADHLEDIYSSPMAVMSYPESGCSVSIAC